MHRSLAGFPAAALVFVLAAPAVASTAPVSPRIPAQSFKAVTSGPNTQAMAQKFKAAGLDVTGPNAAAQLAAFWKTAQSNGKSTMTRHRILASTAAAGSGAKIQAFINAHPAVIFSGGKAISANAAGLQRLTALGMHPARIVVTGVPAPSATPTPSYTATVDNPVSAPAPQIASVLVNNVPNGAFTGSPEDTVLIQGSGLASLAPVNGFVNAPNSMHVSLGTCGGFDLFVTAADPGGTWITAQVAYPTGLVVDRRIKAGLLKIVTAGGQSAPIPVSYQSPLDVETDAFDFDDGPPGSFGFGTTTISPNGLGISAGNSKLGSDRYYINSQFFGGPTDAIGTDTFGSNARLVNDAVYLGSSATAYTSESVGFGFGTIALTDSAAVTSMPDGVDLGTTVQWSWANSTAILYNLTLQIEGPAGARFTNTEPPSGSCGD